MRRSGFLGYGQPQPAMNYHRAHSEHVVAAVAANPCHAAGGGAVQHHTAVHKESFKEVDGDYDYHPRRGHNNLHAFQQQQQQQQAQRHHGYNSNGRHHNGGGGSHRYETYEETYVEETCEEETYSAAAGRHHGHGHGGGGRRYEYETYEETCCEEVEEEEVVGGGGGGYAQLKRGQRCA